MDGYGPAGEPVGAAKETQKAAKASSITLRTLTRRAQRLASDGTGIGVRFQNARDPWNKLSRHVLTSVVRPDDGPIIGVRESHNWNRNQPNALVPADPQAWYVNVSNRSNQQKDAVTAYHGLTAAGSQRRRGDRRGPTQEHRGQSRVLAPPRGRPPAGRLQHAHLPQQRELRFLYPRAGHTQRRPVLPRCRHPGPFCVSRPATAQRPGFSTTRRQRRTPIWGTTDGDTMTISHLANRISPRGKC